MKKLRVFLDTSIILSYFENKSKENKSVKKLFSKEVLEKVQYIINPIVYQELFLTSGRLEKKIDFKELDNYVKVVQINPEKIDNTFIKLKQFRNSLAHSNEYLLLQTAISESDYFLTLDLKLLKIGKINSLIIISLDDFFNILEEHCESIS